MKKGGRNSIIKWVIIGLAVLLLAFIVFKVFTGKAVDPNTSCTDTDNGKDWTVKGHVSGITYYGESYTYEDTCMTQTENLSAGVVGNEYLSEAFCYAYPDENGPKIFYSATVVRCQYDCNDGICTNLTRDLVLNSSVPTITFDIGGISHTVELVTTSNTTATIRVGGISETVLEGGNYTFAGELDINVKNVKHPAYAGDLRQVKLFVSSLAGFCTDSDGGQNYYVKGKTISTYDAGVDVCDTADKEQRRLQEISCKSSISERVTITLYTCPGSCSDGVCVDASTTSTTTTPQTSSGGEASTTPSETQPTTTSAEQEVTSPTITENNIPICTSGCLYEKDKCLPYGYRTSLSYCNIDNTLKRQIDEGNCENNFECTSNVCVEGQCTTPGLFTQFLNWLKTLFGAV